MVEPGSEIFDSAYERKRVQDWLSGSDFVFVAGAWELHVSSGTYRVEIHRADNDASFRLTAGTKTQNGVAVRDILWTRHAGRLIQAIKQLRSDVTMRDRRPPVLSLIPDNSWHAIFSASSQSSPRPSND